MRLAYNEILFCRLLFDVEYSLRIYTRKQTNDHIAKVRVINSMVRVKLYTPKLTSNI